MKIVPQRTALGAPQRTAVVELSPPLTRDRATMDLFEHRYYRLSKNVMRLAGQWPDQSTRAKRGIFAVIMFVLMTGLPPSIFALVRYCDDSNVVLECVIAGLFVAVGIMKWISIIWNSQKVVKLLNRICTNWQVWAQCWEVNILHEYAEEGQKKTILFTAVTYVNTFLFTIQPTIPKIIDEVLKNGTKIGKFGYPVDYYFFDAQNYYWYINLHCYISACVVATPLIASESMLIICMQHVCGVFAALGHKLENSGNNDISVKNIEHLSSIIDSHNDAIEFANLIEATYTWDFFFIIGLGTILINILGVQIFMKMNEPMSIIRFIGFLIGIQLVFYIDCSLSQILIDHSVNIRFYIYNSQWYRLLPRNQKLLQLMTMRCHIPCQLTAGKMLIMSMRNFGLANRTAVSYFAVVRPN